MPNIDSQPLSDQGAYRAGFVALVGRPNVGKSTLMNHVLGEKVAIVSAKAQTTRTRQRGIWTVEDAQVVFVDTPGIHKPHHLLGEQLMTHARKGIAEVDLVWALVDGTVAPGKGDQFVIELAKASGKPVFLIVNKLDMVPKAARMAHKEAYEALGPFAGVFYVSAKHGDGIQALMEATKAAMPPGAPFYDEEELTDQTMRAIAGELVREQVFRQTGEEVPHSAAVVIEEFKEREAPDKTYVLARIVVERQSQKAIVIGKGGAKLKAIGAEARQAIQKLYGAPIYLELRVDVVPKWREQKQHLKQLGYLVE